MFYLFFRAFLNVNISLQELRPSKNIFFDKYFVGVNHLASSTIHDTQAFSFFLLTQSSLVASALF